MPFINALHQGQFSAVLTPCRGHGTDGRNRTAAHWIKLQTAPRSYADIRAPLHRHEKAPPRSDGAWVMLVVSLKIDNHI